MLDIEKILDYLGKEEGLVVHRNKHETDITSPYGIYRAVHPTASIFTYIRDAGISLGLPMDVSTWDRGQREAFNIEINKSPGAKTELRNLAKEFYTEYYSKIFLDIFPKESQLAMISSFTTSEKGAKLSVQRAINDMITMGLITKPILEDDGDFGNITKEALKAVAVGRTFQGEYFGYWFEEKIIRHMGIYYADLVVHRPEKYGGNYRGWKNRMGRLANSR